MPNTIIEDTRNQIGKHKELNAYMQNAGISVMRSKIIVGDYTTPPAVAVDTKAGFEELVANFCSKDRNRVKREILKAQEIGTKLIFLVIDEKATCIEDAKKWKNHFGTVKGETLYKTLDTFTKRYGVQFEFATPEESGQKIIELLSEG
jgi:hypothetical protein